MIVINETIRNIHVNARICTGEKASSLFIRQDILTIRYVDMCAIIEFYIVRENLRG